MEDDDDRFFSRGCLRGLAQVVVSLVILFLLAAAALGPIGGHPKSGLWLQQCRTICVGLFMYSNDNDQNYPDGQSSTEIFQKLLNGKYVTDPAIFYIPLPGKVAPVAGQKLKPENVSFDVTVPLGAATSDFVPVVFMTGYRIDYRPGGGAVPSIKPYPVFGGDLRTWLEWLNGKPVFVPGHPGLAVSYKSNTTCFLLLDEHTGVVPQVIPPEFDAHGQTFRQLTPDGPVP